MKKLHELLGLPLCKGSLGVEIECEGKNLNPIDTETWRTERDGSLRGEYPHRSSEYVMRQPVSVVRLPKAVDELISHQAKATLEFSFRTSVHVHVNVQEYTIDEMLAFLYACLLLEEPLMNFCGETRKGNRFCLRVKDAEGYDKTLNSLFEYGWRTVRDLNGDNIRYSAINIHALKKYGSIEFRGMRGNMDRDVILPWCNTLLNIRNTATKLGSPVAVYNEFIKKGNREFAEEMIGKSFDKFDYPDLDRDMANSFSLNIQLPHIFKNKEKEVEDTQIIAKGLGNVAVDFGAIEGQPAQQYIPELFHRWLAVDDALDEVAKKGHINERVWKEAVFDARLAWYIRQYKLQALNQP
jgi:hypothetical protein